MKLYAVTTATITEILGDYRGPHEVPVFKNQRDPAVYTSRTKAEKLAAALNEQFPDADYNVMAFDA